MDGANNGKPLENPIEMDDLGGTIIFGNTHLQLFLTGISVKKCTTHRFVQVKLFPDCMCAPWIFLAQHLATSETDNVHASCE